MRGRSVVLRLMIGILGVKRPGRNRGAICGAGSRGQCLGLRQLIRHGGDFLRRFGARIHCHGLRVLLRAFGAEDGGHPARTIGQPFRWLNPVGVGDFDGDGRREIAAVVTPHLGVTLKLYEWKGERLEPKHEAAGFSNHAIGSPGTLELKRRLAHWHRQLRH